MKIEGTRCDQWLEQYIKLHQPVAPKAVYEAGQREGFTRAQIKASRKWHGKYINTGTTGSTTLWRWDP